jgi:hypothetical protein
LFVSNVNPEAGEGKGSKVSWDATAVFNGRKLAVNVELSSKCAAWNGLGRVIPAPPVPNRFGIAQLTVVELVQLLVV